MARTTSLRLAPEVLTEHAEQVTLIELCRKHEYLYPELSLIFAVPNGGKRHITTARRLQAEGLKAGIPDLILPVARAGFHSLYIELKRTKDSYATPEQKAMHEALRAQGNAVYVCKGGWEAWDVIRGYLDRK